MAGLMGFMKTYLDEIYFDFLCVIHFFVYLHMMKETIAESYQETDPPLKGHFHY